MCAGTQVKILFTTFYLKYLHQFGIGIAKQKKLGPSTQRSYLFMSFSRTKFDVILFKLMISY